MSKLGFNDLIDMFDDNTEKRVQTEVRVETLRRIIFDLKDKLATNKIEINAAVSKTIRLREEGQERAKEIRELEKEYKTIKLKKNEVERRLKWLTMKHDKLAGEENASILSYEELFALKAQMASTHA